MIVCLCTGTTDRDVHAAIDEGARCLCDFRARGIGTSCGSCHGTLERMMVARGVAVRQLCFEEAIIARIAGRSFDDDSCCPETALPPRSEPVLTHAAD